MNDTAREVINSYALDVSGLDDAELTRLLAAAEALAVKVRTEQGVRRRRRRDQRLLHSMVARASCVFCRRTYGAEWIPEHLLTEHREELATLRQHQRQQRRRAA